MNQGEAGMQPGKVSILGTSDARVHPSVAWARLTTDGIVTIKPETDPDRRQRGTILRKAVCQVLFETFEQVRPSMSFEDIGALTDEAENRIRECFRTTPWEGSFLFPPNRAAIAAFIHRNLLTAADLALKAE
jgi:hypothetical protein